MISKAPHGVTVKTGAYPELEGRVLLFMTLLNAIEKFTEWRKYKIGKFTLKGYDSYLKRFAVFMRDPDLDIERISPDDIFLWVRLMEEVGQSPNTFIPIMESLRQFFKFYKKLGYKVVDPDLIVVPRKDYYKPRVATVEEYKALLSACDRAEENHKERKQEGDYVSSLRNKALLMLLWDTGARVGELVSLETSELQEGKTVIKTEKSRGRRPIREIFWSKRTGEAIKRYIEAKKEYAKKIPLDPKFLFVALKGWSIGRPIGNSTVHHFLKTYSVDAGLSRIVNAHSFRHHKGHDIIQKGGSGVDVMNILGHANITSSQPYVAMNDRELKERAEKFIDS